MRGLVLAACVCLALPAEDRLRLPAGRRPLAEVVAAIPGLRLAGQADPQAVIDLPACDGTWWEGVLAVCRAAGLRPDPGSIAGGLDGGESGACGIGTGPVALSPGRLPPAAASGPLLVLAEPTLTTRRDGAGIRRDLALTVRLRAEPGIAREAVAFARIPAPQLTGDGDRRLALTVDAELRASGGIPPGLAWRAGELPAAPRRLRLDGRVVLARAAAWKLGGAARAGETLSRGEGAARVALAYFDKDPPGTWEGEDLPDEGPLLAMIAPMALSRQDTLPVLTAGGLAVELRQVSTGSSADGTRILRLWRPRAAPEGALELSLSGRSPQTPTEHPFGIALDLAPAAAAPAADPDQPARLSWEAGRTTLDAAVARLAATGSPVMLELGIDGAAAAELPAFSGTFWQATLAVCQAWQLTPAMPEGDAVLISGALRLCQGAPPAACAAGPLLALASPPVIEERVGSGQRERFADLRLRFLLEPRLEAERFTRTAVSWASQARDERGGGHVASGGMPAPQPGRRNRRQQPLPDIPATLRIALAPGPAPRQLTTAGLLWLGRGDRHTATAELEAGAAVTLDLGSTAVELHGAAAGGALPNGATGPGCLVLGAATLSDLSLRLTGADGGELPLRGGYEQGEGRWYFPGQLPPGRLRADLTARRAEADLVQPIELTIRLPDGL